MFTRNPWEILGSLKAAQDSTPRYENTPHAERADVYRVTSLSRMAASALETSTERIAARPAQKLSALQLLPPFYFSFLVRIQLERGTPS